MKEVFNLKDLEGQKNFKSETENTTKFTDVCNLAEPLE